MNPNEEAIKQTLIETLNPTRLELTNESHHHEGHHGAQGGGMHLHLIINAPVFEGETLVNQHRMIYQALTPFMESAIHALRIEIPPNA